MYLKQSLIIFFIFMWLFNIKCFNLTIKYPLFKMYETLTRVHLTVTEIILHKNKILNPNTKNNETMLSHFLERPRS